MRLPLLALLLALTGCWTPPGDQEFATPEPPTPEVDPRLLCTQDGATRCDDNRFQTCIDGAWSAGIACEAPSPLCHPQDGCGSCPAGTSYCLGRDIWQCDESGQLATFIEECGPTETCLAGACYDACSSAESQLSYLGCDFLGVPTVNLLGGEFAFDYAVVVANPSDVPAEVTIRQGGAPYDVVEVPAEDTVAITLPFVEDLQDRDNSVQVADAAYEVSSSIPVAAYQYNPLHFRAPQAPNVFSYTNDASLLLPEHVLTRNYVVSAWPSLGIAQAPALSYAWTPGYVAITGTTNGTEVTITTSAATSPGVGGGAEPGDTITRTLGRGDVLQILSHQPGDEQTNPCAALGGDRTQVGDQEYCLSVDAGDLTGTRIEASEPVAVFAGHACTFVPYWEYACDHLEEMLVPLETWGRTLPVAAPTYPGALPAGPYLLRVITDTPDTLVSFDPPLAPPTTLGPGDVLEVETQEHVVVEGSAPILVTQLLLGQQALDAQQGDPALGTAIPVGQWRDTYDFLTPDSYTWNHLNVVAEEGAQIYMDSQLLTDWEEIGGSDLRVARLRLEPGAHHIESVDAVPFGITSYGYASFTSYLHPGGLNLLR